MNGRELEGDAGGEDPPRAFPTRDTASQQKGVCRLCVTVLNKGHSSQIRFKATFENSATQLCTGASPSAIDTCLATLAKARVGRRQPCVVRWRK